MDEQTWDAVASRFQSHGGAAAFDELIRRLKSEGDYHRLFEARRIAARHEAGVSLFESATSQAIDEITRRQLEDRLVEACREAGAGLLAQGEVTSAYPYFEMIGDVGPVRVALETLNPPAEEIGPIVDLCLSRGLHPVRGIELVLTHYGMCQAISGCEAVLSQQSSAEVRQAVIGRIIRAVHDELVARLRDEITVREGAAPDFVNMTDLLANRDWLFAEDNYHLDTSHLNAVARMARLLMPSPVLNQAIDLCEYGTHLSSRYRYPDPAPFEDVYQDTKRFLLVLAGRAVEEGLAHFREKATQADRSAVGTYPAEVYVHLLESTGRLNEALAFAEEWLTDSSATSQSFQQLCRKANDFERIARWARRRDDPVMYLAALIEANMPAPSSPSH